MRLTTILSLILLTMVVSGEKKETKIEENPTSPIVAPTVDLTAFLVAGEYEDFLQEESAQKPKGASGRAKRHLQKMVAYYETGQYKKMEIEGWNLSKKYSNSFFVKYISMQAYFARKRFKQAAALHEELTASYPLAMYRDSTACLPADMALYRRQYDDAIAQFDECIPRLKEKSMSAYRLILAKEKGHSPKSRLLGSYLEYDGLYPYSPAVIEIQNRFRTLYTDHNIPSQKSPMFNAWLYAMKRNKMLKDVLKESWLELEEPPFALISYLLKQERFTDAQNLAKRGKEFFKEDDTKRYQYGWRIYRALIKGARAEAAGDHLMTLFSELKNSKRKQQALFFAAFAYEEAGLYEKSKKLFEQIVYQDERSPYFLLSLHRLGLHYLMGGNEWYTATLWTNFLLADDALFRGQYGGSRLLNAMRNITTILNRQNGFYTLGGISPLVCEEFKKCETSSGFISYYDFLWQHINHRFSTKFMKGYTEDNRFGKWTQNREESRENVLEKLRKDLKKLPRAVRNGEQASMMKTCAENGLSSCLNFYFSMLRNALHTAKKPPEELAVEAESFLRSAETAKILLFSSATRSLLNLAERDADLVDHYFSRNKKDLSYAPHLGEGSGWLNLYPTPYKETALAAAKQHGVPLALLYAIMRAETFYRPHLTSPVGAAGLMQIMPTTFEKIKLFGALSLDDPFNPRQNIKAAAWYLGKLLKRFDNNPLLAAAAYNGGPHNVTKWIGRYDGLPFWLFIESIPFRETRNYVKKVARYIEIYSYLYEGHYYDLELHAPLKIKESPEVVNF